MGIEIESNSMKEEIINEENDELTEEEEKSYREKYGHLRKVSILSKIPIEEWTKEELLNLIDEYELYCRIQTEVKKEKAMLFTTFILSGEYERMSVFEEYKMGE